MYRWTAEDVLSVGETLSKKSGVSQLSCSYVDSYVTMSARSYASEEGWVYCKLYNNT